MTGRGRHLLQADHGFATGGGLFARWRALGIRRIVDRVDRSLELGGLKIALPDGTERTLGFRGEGPRAAVTINSWKALVRLATSGSVGWYKAWANGEWESADPVKIFELFSANAVSLGNVGRAKGPAKLVNRLWHILRDNSPIGAKANIAAHYDLGNDFYAAWLDETMTYSSARFAAPTDSLEQAQRQKVDLLLDRLELAPGERLLEIGCGWGNLAIQAAQRGVQVVGLTLSTQQKDWAEARIAELGLTDRIQIRLQDYRDCAEQFDAVASVEMVEAVGRRWWPTYLDSIARNLKPGGKAALQFIAIDHRIYESYAATPDFIQTYIFPGGILIDEPAFAGLAVERGLSWQDRDGFRLDYAETLRRWRDRYNAAVSAGTLKGFDEPFHQLWRYYLMYCEGGFRGGSIDVAQVTMVKS